VNRYIETVSRQTGIAVTATNVGSSANQKLPYSPKRTAPLLETLRKAILKRAGLSTHSQNENSWSIGELLEKAAIIVYHVGTLGHLLSSVRMELWLKEVWHE